MQQKLPALRTLRKFRSQWVCSKCRSKKARRFLSTTSNRAEEEETNFVPIAKRKSDPIGGSTVPLSTVESKNDPEIIFSLIQPTGIPHLGNYLGAIRRWKELEKEDLSPDASTETPSRPRELYLGLADLHSLTGNQSPIERRQNVKETFAALLALGLGTSPGHDCDLFIQSQVSAHTYLMWILSTITSTGSLSRMVQWKEKSGVATELISDTARTYPMPVRDSAERLKLGLFSYPVLQAADILLYNATHVPVGEDQAQHVELTRTLARSFNRTFNQQVFKEPKLLISPARRIMSLQNPTKKMSKSDPDVMSRILVTDSREVIGKKLKQAKTDSIDSITYDPENRPAVANLIDILKFVTKSDLSGDEIAREHANMRFFGFKQMIANAIFEELDGVRDRFEELMIDKNFLIKKMFEGNARAQKRAAVTLKTVNEVVGLDYPETPYSVEVMSIN